MIPNDKLPLGLRQPWRWVQPTTTAQLVKRLEEARDYNVHERERENLCSVAAGKIAELERDAARWRYIESVMTHERCGPNIGWTIGDLHLAGDNPAEAVDAARARKGEG